MEQNHADNVLHLGKGAHWCIAEQCSHLLEKHQENTKKFNNIEIDWWYKFVYCKETDIDDDNDEDMKARNCLAKWPYENIWRKIQKQDICLIVNKRKMIMNITYGQFMKLKPLITP